ncbi:MAG: hypothetical protein IJN97_07725, partial [Oscillospiraceae bacterium]|nr:hypothetical protein [Oscillospiraceae bacterium]
MVDHNRFLNYNAWNKIHIKICPIWQSKALTNYILIDTMNLYYTLITSLRIIMQKMRKKCGGNELQRRNFTMKKLIALTFAGIMIFALCACTGGS